MGEGAALAPLSLFQVVRWYDPHPQRPRARTVSYRLHEGRSAYAIATKAKHARTTLWPKRPEGHSYRIHVDETSHNTIGTRSILSLPSRACRDGSLSRFQSTGGKAPDPRGLAPRCDSLIGSHSLWDALGPASHRAYDSRTSPARRHRGGSNGSTLANAWRFNRVEGRYGCTDVPELSPASPVAVAIQVVIPNVNPFITLRRRRLPHKALYAPESAIHRPAISHSTVPVFAFCFGIQGVGDLPGRSVEGGRHRWYAFDDGCRYAAGTGVDDGITISARSPNTKPCGE